MEDDSSKKEKPPGPELVQKEAVRKNRKRLTPDDKFNNFCKAMAEQELFETGAFPNAKDAGYVREEFQKAERKWTEEEAQKRRKAFTVKRNPER